jgi:hypothetical protein
MVLNIVASSQVTATPSCCLSTSFVSSEVQPLFASDSKGTILGFCISYSEISELNFAGSSGSGKTTEVGASWSCSEIQNGLAPALSPPSGLHRVPRLVRRSRRTARRRTALRRARSRTSSSDGSHESTHQDKKASLDRVTHHLARNPQYLEAARCRCAPWRPPPPRRRWTSACRPVQILVPARVAKNALPTGSGSWSRSCARNHHHAVTSRSRSLRYSNRPIARSTSTTVLRTLCNGGSRA